MNIIYHIIGFAILAYIPGVIVYDVWKAQKEKLLFRLYQEGKLTFEDYREIIHPENT